MHKKFIVVSHLPARLPGRVAKRILLSRETIRTLTSNELTQAVGGNEECPCTSTAGSSE
jgi:hypothetical protein